MKNLGTVPLLQAGSEALKQRYLPPVARGEAVFSYALPEPEAGSGAGSDEDACCPGWRQLRAERNQAVPPPSARERAWALAGPAAPGAGGGLIPLDIDATVVT